MSADLVKLASGALLAACGGTTVGEGDGGMPRDDCVGTYEGTYSGDAAGDIDGRLRAGGAFDLTFSPSGAGANFSGSGQLNDNGTITFDAEPLVVTGRLNEAQCRATGRWDTGEAEGSWSATRR